MIISNHCDISISVIVSNYFDLLYTYLQSFPVTLIISINTYDCFQSLWFIIVVSMNVFSHFKIQKCTPRYALFLIKCINTLVILWVAFISFCLYHLSSSWKQISQKFYLFSIYLSYLTPFSFTWGCIKYIKLLSALIHILNSCPMWSKWTNSKIQNII